MMKCFIRFFSFVAIFASLASANSGISIGGVVSIDTIKSGGGIEFGVPLLKDGSISLNNYISILGYGENSNTALMLQEKLAIGDFSHSHIRLYGFFGGSFGVFSDVRTKSQMFASPYLWEGFCGGGVDIVTGVGSVVIEEGGGYSYTTSSHSLGTALSGGCARIQVGFRGYF